MILQNTRRMDSHPIRKESLSPKILNCSVGKKKKVKTTRLFLLILLKKFNIRKLGKESENISKNPRKASSPLLAIKRIRKLNSYS